MKNTTEENNVKERSVYFDYAATTPLDPRVLDAMLPYLQDGALQGNPSSLHRSGRLAKAGLDAARRTVADVLGSQGDEVVFTGSGTESDNLAMMGVAHAYGGRGKHIVVSTIEHKAILESAKALAQEGFSISYAPVGEDGIVDVAKLVALLRPDTILVSVMFVNNEVGSIQPIKEISAAVKNFRGDGTTPLFHVDACQAATVLPIRPRELGIDLLTLNGAKIYGPKGSGCLWIRRGVKLSPIIHGGGQEFGLRSGTENIALAIGFAEALKIAQKECLQEEKRLAALNRSLRDGIKDIEGISFSSPSHDASPSILNVSFRDTEGESLLLELDHYGIYCSTGSACAATDLKPSYVLLAMGIAEELAHASLRFSMGRFTSAEDINYLLKVLPIAVARIRSVCPVGIFKTVKEGV